MTSQVCFCFVLPDRPTDFYERKRAGEKQTFYLDGT